MNKLLVALAATLVSGLVSTPASAQEEGYRDYDAAMRNPQIKAPVNVGHKVDTAISRSKRNTQGMPGALGDADLSGDQRTRINGRDVVNVGGLVVNSAAPISANNIIIISRPGGGGIEGPMQRPMPRR
jgi:hypothetical protein